MYTEMQIGVYMRPENIISFGNHLHEWLTNIEESAVESMCFLFLFRLIVT